MGEISLLRCEKCGLVTTSPRPAPSELGEHYPETYYSYAPQVPSRKQRIMQILRAYKGGYPSPDGWLLQSFWTIVMRLVGNFFLSYVPYRGPGKSLLEVGCGTGDDLEWARELGWEVYGLEIGEQAVAIARSRGLDVKNSTFEAAEFQDGAFDCIVMTQVLEHLYSPRSALDRCRKLLRPGGLLLIAVPKFDSWPRHVLGECWHSLLFPIHLHHFDQAVLEAMLRDVGFNLREVRLSPKVVSFFQTLRTIKRCHVPLRKLACTRGTMSDGMLMVAEKLETGSCEEIVFSGDRTPVP